MRRSDPIAILTAIVALAIAALTAAGFLARAAWTFDLAASFRPQYAVIALLAAAVLALRRRGWLAVAAGLVGLVNAALVVPLYLAGPDDGAAAVEAAPLTVVSHNLNGSLGVHVDQVVESLRTETADVVVYFEAPSHLAPAIARLDTDYEMVLSGRGAGGVEKVVLSREPVAHVAVLDLGPGSRSESFTLTVERDGRAVQVLGIRTRSPRQPNLAEIRGAELDAVARWVGEQTDPVLVIGDLNATPWTPDFRDLVDATGLRNSQRGFGVQASWPTWFPPLGIPIDHALHSDELVVVDRSLGAHHGSPHRSLRVELLLRDEALAAGS